MNRFILLLLFLLVGIFNQVNFACPFDNKTEPSPEEYIVYKDLLNQMFIGKYTTRLVIEGLTAADDFYIDYPNVRKKLTARFKGTNKNFIANNTLSYELKNKFNLRINIIILKSSEREELFKELNNKSNYDEWAEVLSQKYSKGGAEIITLSRVGFNANKNQALVFVGSQCSWTCGQGNYILLKKKQGRWKIKKKSLKWIS